MTTMKSIYKLLLLAVVAMAAACYDDYDAPVPDQPYTAADFEAQGLEYISLKELKAMFWRETGAGVGAVASLPITEPLYMRGKVISTDRFGSIYKTVYLYDEASKTAMELKLNSGNYVFYPAGRELFVKLNGLVLGNYRGMVSIGAASGNNEYSNDNIELPVMVKEHVFRGEQIGMTKADTLVVNSSNYHTLTDADLGRLVRFEGVTSTFGTAPWGYKNTFPNYFANQVSYDVNSAGTLDGVTWTDFISGTPTWAAMGKMNNEVTQTYFYGSAWFSYNKSDAGQDSNAPAGNYVVRTSGYAHFRDAAIPADGTVVDLTAIYVKYTNSSGRYVTYQLTLNDGADVVVK